MFDGGSWDSSSCAQFSIGRTENPRLRAIIAAFGFPARKAICTAAVCIQPHAMIEVLRQKLQVSERGLLLRGAGAPLPLACS